MMTTWMRSASKMMTVAAIAFGAVALAACGDAGQDGTGESEAALGCRPGTSCDLGPSCDPSTACCFQGSQLMGAYPCGAALYAAGCRGTGYPTNKAFAREVRGPGHWWFEAYCPATSAAYIAATTGACVGNAEWNTSGDPCTVGNPGAGHVDLLFDPNCPSGCKSTNY